MREIRQSGSVRGVRRKPYPYRDPILPVQSTVPLAGPVEDAEGGYWRKQAAPEGGLRLGDKPKGNRTPD